MGTCHHCAKIDVQGRRQEFFQGMALGRSRGGLSNQFYISRGGGAQPRIFVASVVKMKEFRGQGGIAPHLPIRTAHACVDFCLTKYPRDQLKLRTVGGGGGSGAFETETSLWSA